MSIEKQSVDVRRCERCTACGKPTCAGEDFDGPCVEDSDLACALRQRDEARALRAVDAEKVNREIRLLQGRVSDLKFALGSDATGWFDRFKNSERERDEANAQVELMLKHGVHTEETRALGDALGLRDGKHTAASTATAALAEIQRLRGEVAELLADADGEQSMLTQAIRERNRMFLHLTALRAALRDYYHECTCRGAHMEPITLNARRTLAETEDLVR